MNRAMRGQYVQALSVALRVLPLAGKYVFSLLLVRMYPLKEVGLFNNATGYVSVLVYFVGLQYYYHVNRQLPKATVSARGRLLQGQFLLFAVIYLVVAVPVVVIFNRILGLGPTILVMLLVSHLNLEAYRALYALKRPLQGAVIFGLGNGLWSIPVGLGMVLLHWRPSVGQILAAVVAFGLVSATWGLRTLLRDTFPARNRPFVSDLSALRQDVRVGLMTTVPIMVSTVAQRGSELLGRFILQFSSGLASVGVFSSFLKSLQAHCLSLRNPASRS